MKISRHIDHACVMNLECLNSVYCIGIILKTTTQKSVDIFIVLDTLADQLDTTKRFGDHTVTFISEYKNRVTKRHKCV